MQIALLQYSEWLSAVERFVEETRKSGFADEHARESIMERMPDPEAMNALRTD